MPTISPYLLVAATTLLLAGCASDTAGVRPLASPRLTDAAIATPTAPAPANLPDLSESPRLADLLRIAVDRSPVIHAARERALAAGEGAAIEGWLPNPQMMVGWYETSVETRVGPQQWSIGIRQNIPFPTKLDAKAEIANSEAARARIAYERYTRDVLVDVVQAAHEIAYIDAALQTTAEVEALLERYVAASAEGESDTLLSELFRADTQRAQLTNDRVTLTELRAVEAQHLRSLLDLPPSLRIGTPVSDAVPNVRASVEELLSLAEEHNQELREAGIALETARLRSSLARQRHVPDLAVGVTRISTDRLPSGLGMDPDGNGDDPLILSLGVDLPIWVHRDVAAVRRAKALERAAALERMDVVQRTRDRVARAWFRVGNADRLHRLYSEVLVPRAATAARSAEDLLSTGKGSVAGVLETIAVFHNFRLAAARAKADHGRAIADLERAIGQPFEVVAPTGGQGGER